MILFLCLKATLYMYIYRNVSTYEKSSGKTHKTVLLNRVIEAEIRREIAGNTDKR